MAVIAPDARVVDDAGFPKDGTASPGVARQGKVANCQIGVSVHAVSDPASCPLNRRLFVPARWDEGCAATPEAAAAVRDRRRRAGIPPTQPVGLGTHALAAGRDAAVQLTWREGSRA